MEDRLNLKQVVSLTRYRYACEVDECLHRFEGVRGREIKPGEEYVNDDLYAKRLAGDLEGIFYAHRDCALQFDLPGAADGGIRRTRLSQIEANRRETLKETRGFDR